MAKVAEADASALPDTARPVQLIVTLSGDDELQARLEQPACAAWELKTMVEEAVAPTRGKRRILNIELFQGVAAGDEMCSCPKTVLQQETIDRLQREKTELKASLSQLQHKLKATGGDENGMRKQLEDQQVIIAALVESNKSLMQQLHAQGDAALREQLDDQQANIAKLKTSNVDLQSKLDEVLSVLEATNKLFADYMEKHPFTPTTEPNLPDPEPTPTDPEPTPTKTEPSPPESPPLTPKELTSLSERLLDAAREGRVEQMLELLSQGADVQYKDGRGRAALDWAAFYGHLEALRLVMAAGAPLDAADTEFGRSALHWAALNGHASCVEALAAEGAHVDARTAEGFTPLHDAALNSHETAVRALLEAGADPTIANNSGQLPADLADDAVRGLLAPKP